MSIINVRNLRISFRTNNGTVKAVRDISFDVERGETLAVVGESGSGKSVTARALMGILAGNAIVEGGEILYDGMDLMKIEEHDFHKLRGNRISMIFQDPLSSLNPIVRIGKQLDEAMLLNGKANQREAKKEFKGKLSLLRHHTLAAYEEKDDKASANTFSDTLSLFRQVIAYGTAEEKKYLKSLPDANACFDAEMPIDFFALGYFRAKNYNCTEPGKTPEETDLHRRAVMEREFTVPFLKEMELGILHSAKEAHSAKKAALPLLKEIYDAFSEDAITSEKYKKLVKPVINAVNAGIDRLSITKDSIAYTFDSSLRSALSVYTTALKASKKRNDVDLSLPIENLRTVISRVMKDYEDAVLPTDLSEQAAALLDNLKKCASAKVFRITKSMAKARSIQLMQEVGIPDAAKRYKQYPFQFSGGMRQRIVIAIALAANPDILICDEPTTALDVTIQAQILDLINGLKKSRKLTVIFITHDLGVVASMADKIAVMYAGKIVEYGSVNEVFYDPRHPYTWALLASMPDLETKEKLESIPGTPPNMIFPPKGDAFAARNKYALQIDFEEQPPMFEVSPTHFAATWLLHPDAPHVDPPKIVTDRIERMKKYGGAEQ